MPKTIRLNASRYFIMKFLTIEKIHSFDLDFKDFMELYKEYTKEPYSFLVNAITLSLETRLRFRKKLL